MWEFIKDIFNYPIIDWNSDPVFSEEGVLETPAGDIFTFTFLNIILIALIYLAAKIFIKYIKRYFKALHLTDKQLRIEGKEIAVWKLAKQLIYLFAFYICFLSLKISNPHLDLSDILAYEFFRIKNTNFHIAVYHLFLTVAIVFITRITLNIMKVFLLRTVRKNEKIDSGTEYIYVQLAKYIIYGIAIIVLLRSFGVDLDLFLTATAFLLVGVGLGLQTIFRDYFSGILLLLEGTVKVGDIVEVEAGAGQDNFVAKIIQINLRTSKVETRNDKILIIPNSKLTHENVINWSVGTQITRFSIPITFHYGIDTELVKSIMVGCAEEHPKVVKNKKPIVRLLDFGPNGLHMDLLFWADQNLFIEILKSDIRFAIEAELRKHEITIPYTQADIHLRSGSESINNNNPQELDN